MVSTAALRSRRMRMEIKPESAAMRRSLMILMMFQCYGGDGNRTGIVHTGCYG